MSKMLSMLPVAFLDLAIVGAVASVSYGCWMVHPPLGFIVGGSITLALCLKLASKPA
jgi:hypothetical protein